MTNKHLSKTLNIKMFEQLKMFQLKEALNEGCEEKFTG